MFTRKPFWVEIVDKEGDTVHYAQCTKAEYFGLSRVLLLSDNRPFLKGQIVMEVPYGCKIKADRGKIKVIK